jgi:hypothetical protein
MTQVVFQALNSSIVFLCKLCIMSSCVDLQLTQVIGPSNSATSMRSPFTPAAGLKPEKSTSRSS